MVVETDPRLDALVERSCERARSLIDHAERIRTHRERVTRRRFARLLRDPRAIEVTMVLTDEVMRVASPKKAARILRRASKYASPAGFGLLNAAGLRFLGMASHTAPTLALSAVHARVRALSKDIILAQEATPLRRRIASRSRAGIRMNINVLGEAVLGEREAESRLAQILEMMRRDEVDYVSVKLSSLVSQIVTVDHAGSLLRVAEKLRTVYGVAQDFGVFVNLDMEEYRDLRLTVDAFCAVLSEPRFDRLDAGIVLQAYLPESHWAFAQLAAWGRPRYERTGATVKVRLVKGANLAMERTEAELHGWTPAPYATKADVDASYLRLLDVALRQELAGALRIGVASHNLFDLAWAMEVATSRGVLPQLDIEMLEGMANAEALAIARTGQGVLLYAPVARDDDFAAAVAYLVRRLDENTSKENYLRAAFYIARDDQVFSDQQSRFISSVQGRHALSVASRRHAADGIQNESHFENVADGDPTDPSYVGDVELALASNLALEARSIPLVIDATEIEGPEVADGGDPSDGGRPWYRYSVATGEQVESAIRSARGAATSWAGLKGSERREILNRAAEVMQRHRASSIAVMMRDGGKTVAEADPEVSEAIDFARYYADRAGDRGRCSPLGVVLVVPPWNFPYAIPAGGVCAALAAGNTVILKPAPESVATAWELVGQLWEAGVPRSALQFVPTRDDECGRRLVTHEGVDGVILTGSFDTAQLFTSWRPEINLLAETSGKNAILISSNADIDLAVKDLVQSAFGHAGQKCSAASLAIVERTVTENRAFWAQLTDAVESLCVGRSYDLDTSIGPIIRAAEPALARALGQLDAGESWLLEPQSIDESGQLWRPGVKIGVMPGSWSHQSEWFGPVLAVMTAPDFATALAWQNAVPYALTAGIHSLDEAECEFWIEHIEAGNLYVNRGVTGAVVNRQPFGGWKASSVGPTAKAGGRHYVDCLRRWSPLVDADQAMSDLEQWWSDFGSQARDGSGLVLERNLQRYRRSLGPITVRIDTSFDAVAMDFLTRVRLITGAHIEFSSAVSVPSIPDVVVESPAELVGRSSSAGRVRWLSRETAPTLSLLARGISLDRRPLAQAGGVEGPRWLNEQSVAIVNHRYGNVNGGPKPRCRGLGEV